ncbi:MAG TPA: PAS domain S-box protein [Burkholderiaceae bacterium]|nr:PAS domain S-box protein [Burkholderiaceae bacterium]
MLERESPDNWLREDDDRFVALANHAPVGIYLNDAAGNCVYANPRLCEMMQLSAQDVLGQGWARFIHPEDIDQVMRARREGLATGRPIRTEHRFVRGDQTVLWVIAKSTPFGSGATAGRVGTLSDITERKSAELALENSNRRMQAVLDASPLAILTMDARGIVLGWSGGAERMFGWSESEAMGLICPTVPDEELEDFLDMIRRVLAGEPFRGEVRHRRKKSGEVVLAAISASPLHDGSGASTAIVAILDDVTERERAARQLDVLIEQREQFVQDLHDGCIQSIYAIGLNLEESRRLTQENPLLASEKIADATANLNLVIEELRLVLKGEREITGGRDLKAALDRTIQMLGERAPQFAIELDDAVIDRLTQEQATQLTQIAREAISNTARHAQARTARVTLRKHGANGACLEIEDDGKGFDPHAHVNQGLGLCHIEARARKLGGRSEVISASGRGTRIVIEISQAS